MSSVYAQAMSWVKASSSDGIKVVTPHQQESSPPMTTQIDNVRQPFHVQAFTTARPRHVNLAGDIVQPTGPKDKMYLDKVLWGESPEEVERKALVQIASELEQDNEEEKVRVELKDLQFTITPVSVRNI